MAADSTTTNATDETTVTSDWHQIEPQEFRREQIKMLWDHLPLILLADIATGSFLLALLLT
ncbi:MAG: hypothetical protein HOK53_09420, partial [Gammaproteobacteria bacterium]|nr:hypothetical protein [Gammaproteobacteria bacterium]